MDDLGRAQNTEHRTQIENNDLMYSVRNVSYKYPDGTHALSDISIEVKKGEFIGLLGANGSGKTTLLRAMDKLLKGVDGSIYLDGADIRTLSPKEIYKKVYKSESHLYLSQ